MKKYFICILILFLITINLSGCVLSPTYYGRLPIKNLKLSSDCSRLFYVSSGLLANMNQTLYIFNIIDTNSGEIIFEHNKSFSSICEFHPNGGYFVSKKSDTNTTFLWSPHAGLRYPKQDYIITSVESGEVISNFTCRDFCFSPNGNYFITLENNDIHIWNAINFSIIKIIRIDNFVTLFSISPDGSKIAVESLNNRNSTLSIIDIYTGDIKYLHNYSYYSVYVIHYISWSNDGTELQIVKREKPIGTRDFSDYFNLIIWNISNMDIIYEKSFDYKWEGGYNDLIYVNFGNYIIEKYDSVKTKLYLYNLSGLKKILDIGQKRITSFDVSFDENVFAIAYKGNIELRTLSTGKIINSFNSKEYELVRPIPGFDLIFTIFCIVVILIWKRKKNIYK